MSDSDIICLSSDDDGDLLGPSIKTLIGKKTTDITELQPAVNTLRSIDQKSSSAAETSRERPTNNSAVKTPKARKSMKTTQVFPKQGNYESQSAVKTPKARKSMKTTQVFPKQGNCGSQSKLSFHTKGGPDVRKTDILIVSSRDKEVLEVEKIPSQDESPKISPKPIPVIKSEAQPSKSDTMIESPITEDAPEIVNIPKAEIAQSVDAKSCANHIVETNTEGMSDIKSTNSGPSTIIHTSFGAKPVGTSLVDLFISAIQPVLKKNDNFVIDKLRRHASAANPEALDTAEFNSATQTLIKNVNQDPSNVFVYAKKFLDLLKSIRNAPKSDTTGSALHKEGNAELPAQNGDSARIKRHIVKLERFLVKLSKKIKEFSEREVDLDDDTSSYIIESKLKERFMKTTKKICELKGAVLDTKRKIEKKIKYEGTRYPEINKAIVRLLKRGPDMPDFHDVITTVKKANEMNNIHLSDRMINDLAQKIFETIGHEFQERRKKDLYVTMQTHVPEGVNEEDPADKDHELLRKLIENRKAFEREENEIMTKYSDKQKELKEEPQEVVEGEEEITSEGDEKEQEESDSVIELGDSEEDGDSDENDTEEEEEEKSSANISQRKSLANDCNEKHNKSHTKRRASTPERNSAGPLLKVPKLCISD